MARTDRAAVLGLLAIIVGAMLVLGGLLFLLATSLMGAFPRVVLVPPLVQMALGVLAAAGGLLLRRGHIAATILLVCVGLGVVANLVFLASVFFSAVG